LLRVEIECSDFEAALVEVLGHREAHVAEANETNFLRVKSELPLNLEIKKSSYLEQRSV
jgi:hypothetical protein